MNQQPSRYPTWKDYDYPLPFQRTHASGKHISAGDNASLNVTRGSRLPAGRSKKRCPPHVSAAFLTLSEHPRADWNDLWLGHQPAPRRQTTACSEESVTSDVKDSDGLPGYAQPVQTARPGMYLPAHQLNHRKPKVWAARPPSSPAPQAKKSTANNTAASRCSFTGPRRSRATLNQLLASEFLPVGLQ